VFCISITPVLLLAMCCVCARNGLVQLGVRPPFCTCACVACCSGPACSAPLVRQGQPIVVSLHTLGVGQGLGKALPGSQHIAPLHATCCPLCCLETPEETHPGHRVSAKKGCAASEGATQHRRPTGCMHMGNDHSMTAESMHSQLACMELCGTDAMMCVCAAGVEAVTCSAWRSMQINNVSHCM
jgi:hypothetical protein